MHNLLYFSLSVDLSINIFILSFYLSVNRSVHIYGIYISALIIFLLFYCHLLYSIFTQVFLFLFLFSILLTKCQYISKCSDPFIQYSIIQYSWALEMWFKMVKLINSTCYIYLICWRCVGLFLVLQIAAAAVPDSVAQTA